MASERNTDEAGQKRRRQRPGSSSSISAHLSGRIDAFTSLVLVFPLFLLYQLGILASRGQNGVDFLTSALVDLCRRDLENYLFVLLCMLLVYAALLILLRRSGQFSVSAFLLVAAESCVYALTMGSAILFLMREFIGVLPGLALAGGRDPIDVLVISAGAGVHEELIFRVIGMGGLTWLLAGVLGRARAWLFALVLSSLAFSLAHHLGPAGEHFEFAAFTYRFLAGVFFALVYRLRGAGVAIWTHTLYDVYVFSLA